MKITFFSTQPYDKTFFDARNQDFGYTLSYQDTQLNPQTVSLAEGSEVVCVFVNDKVDETVIKALAAGGTKIIALRCAGFNNVNLEEAKAQGMRVCRVPAYSPEAVAEHALAMILTLNRKIHKAYNRVREQNFSLNGLLGFDLHGKTVGIVGTGNIGKAFARLLSGFGCKVLAYDIAADPTLVNNGVHYVPLDTLMAESDIISLHCPLNEHTRHLINKERLAGVKKA
nr:NAD(P)-dependent oxidoreductase [Chitinophaga sedimenti]